MVKIFMLCVSFSFQYIMALWWKLAHCYWSKISHRDKEGNREKSS